MDPFNIYLQTLLSQALDSDFLNVLQQQNGENQMKGSVKEPNMFNNYETEKLTRKASDVAENLQF